MRGPWEHDGVWIDIQPDGSGVHKFHCLCDQANDVTRELWALTLPGMRQMIDQCRAAEKPELVCQYCAGEPEPGWIETINNGPTVSCPICNPRGEVNLDDQHEKT